MAVSKDLNSCFEDAGAYILFALNLFGSLTDFYVLLL